jgi:hypothetical protein
MKNLNVTIVLPVHDSESIIPTLFSELSRELVQPLINDGARVSVVVVDDGSRDGTVTSVLANQQVVPYLKLIKLSRSFGFDAAAKAGLQTISDGVAVILNPGTRDSGQLVSTLLSRQIPLSAHWVVSGSTSATPLARVLGKTTAGVLRQLGNVDRNLDQLLGWAGFPVERVVELGYGSVSQWGLSRNTGSVVGVLVALVGVVACAGLALAFAVPLKEVLLMGGIAGFAGILGSQLVRFRNPVVSAGPAYGILDGGQRPYGNRPPRREFTPRDRDSRPVPSAPLGEGDGSDAGNDAGDVDGQARHRRRRRRYRRPGSATPE